jgi:hypothetical protein
VAFERAKVSPTAAFVKAVGDAVADNSEPAVKLLRVFQRYGEFFATDIILGGRFIFRHDKAFNQTYTEEKNQAQFLLACKALIPTEGPPIEGAGNWGAGLSQQEKDTVNQQKATIEFEIRGGNTTLMQPDKWTPTVAKYINWKVIGHNNRSLEPTFNYLTDDLRAKCIQVLRKYFLDQGLLVGTALAGATHATEFGKDAGDVKRIVQIKVNHGKNIDGLTVTNELKTGQLKVNPLLGWERGEKNDIVGPLAANDEICAIEGSVAPDGLLRQLCFYTTLGSRFPIAEDTYYGKRRVRR